MVINDSKKFVIFHIPKTGGTTVRHVYRNLPGNNTKDVADQHETPAQLLKRCPQFRSYNMNIVVRNPWHRMESMFRHQFRHHNVWRHNGYTFARFMEELDVEDSLANKSMRNNTVMVPQHIYFVEDLSWWRIEDINMWAPRTLSAPPRLNESPGPPCIWTKKAFENFEKFYGLDVKNLDHLYAQPDDLLEE